VTSGAEVSDQLFNSFGLRQIQVDPSAPRLLLNGAAVAFHGVALHDERIDPAGGDRPAGGPATGALEYLSQLEVQAGRRSTPTSSAPITPHPIRCC